MEESTLVLLLMAVNNEINILFRLIDFSLSYHQEKWSSSEAIPYRISEKQKSK